MAERLELKTKALEIRDYHSIDISKFIYGFTVDEARYQKDLERILRRYGRKEDVAVVSEGDTVTLSCRSENPRFNKENVTVPVGKGLFSKDLEAGLIGLPVGEPRSLDLNGTAVTLTVTKAIRTVLPELTDEVVASFGMEGVSNVAELRRYCVGKQVDAFLLEAENPDQASAYVWQELAKTCRILRDPAEEASVRARAEKRLQELPAAVTPEASDDAEEDPEAEAGEAIGGFDREQMLQIFLSELDLAAVGAALMERDGRALTVEDYEAYIAKLCEAYPDRSEAQIRAEHDPKAYAIEHYADYLAQTLDGYVAACFKEVLTKE